MAHAISKYTSVSAVLSLLSVCVLTLQSGVAAAQSFDEGDMLHLGAPIDSKGIDKGIDKGDKGIITDCAGDKGDKGTDKGNCPPPTTPPEKPKRPPTVPKSGPGTVFALGLIAGAGYWTYRRSTMATSYVVAK